MTQVVDCSKTDLVSGKPVSLLLHNVQANLSPFFTHQTLFSIPFSDPLSLQIEFPPHTNHTPQYVVLLVIFHLVELLLLRWIFLAPEVFFTVGPRFLLFTGLLLVRSGISLLPLA